MRTLMRVACFAVILCLMCTNISFAADTKAEVKQEMDLEYLQSIIDMIKEKYKDAVTDEQLIEGAINGMFDTMDKYTDFYNKEEAETFFTNIDGSYVGIGVRITSDDKNIIVVEVFEDSPADKAEIITGDIILSADGQSLEGKTSEEAANIIKGKAGTKVTIEIQRVGEKSPLKIDVERREVKINPVSYKINGDIGYIKLDSFNANSSSNIKKALEEMDKNNIKKLVVDIRDNPGGEVTQVVKIAENFVPEGLITKLDFKSEKAKDEEYYSKNKALKYKLVVLVNESSASASEILAGAVQDTESGILVGTKTYGKGKVQNLYPVLSPAAYKKYEDKLGVKIVDGYDLMNNYGIYPPDSDIIGWTKITTGEYYTPKGRMIDGTGLQPDYIIENTYVQNDVDLRDIKKLSQKVKPGLNDKSLDVLYAERILKFCGYSIDEPDMLLDEQSFKAIYQFQKDSGLYPYGVLDFTTQQALNNKLEQLISQHDKQLAKAYELLKE